MIAQDDEKIVLRDHEAVTLEARLQVDEDGRDLLTREARNGALAFLHSPADVPVQGVEPFS